jgi:hypothetical protein
MKAEPAFTRGNTTFVSPAQVMTGLRRRAGERRRYLFDHLIPFSSAVGALLGVSVAVRR